MPDASTPWFGLAALIAMFAIPFLPRWLFEGPRKVRHWPQRHVCAEEALVEPVPVAAAVGEVEPQLKAPPAPLRGELRRVPPGRQLERRREAWISR